MHCVISIHIFNLIRYKIHNECNDRSETIFNWIVHLDGVCGFIEVKSYMIKNSLREEFVLNCDEAHNFFWAITFTWQFTNFIGKLFFDRRILAMITLLSAKL